MIARLLKRLRRRNSLLTIGVLVLAEVEGALVVVVGAVEHDDADVPHSAGGALLH